MRPDDIDCRRDLRAEIERLHSQLANETRLFEAEQQESARLRGKNDRLREALQAVVDHGDKNGMRDWKVMKLARKALGNNEQSEQSDVPTDRT